MKYSGRMSFEQFLKNLFDLSEISIFCPIGLGCEYYY